VVARTINRPIIDHHDIKLRKRPVQAMADLANCAGFVKSGNNRKISQRRELMDGAGGHRFG